MRTVTIGKARVSRLVIGGNPFSGFSHQNGARDREMVEYYTPERIHDALRQAEEAGINTVFARTDDHVFGVLSDYWRRGGKVQWFAQVCTERDKPDVWRDWLARAVDLGAAGAYLHGGVVDSWHANGQFELLEEALERMQAAKIAAGFAGHQPEAHAWIRDHLQPDFQMCSYYNPTDRSHNPLHQNAGERWEDEDRERMLGVIRSIPTPVVHYKVLAAGNKPIGPSFERLAHTMRAQDIVCLGMFIKDDAEMVSKNVALFDRLVG